jgi:hypothetical protein
MFDFHSFDFHSNYVQIALGVLVIVLGGSFAYKFFLACVLGKVSYWHGFLPITIVSPLLTHLPSGEKSLVKKTQGIWVHIVMSPIFLICMVLCFAVGTDLTGLPGVQTLNWVLNGCDDSKPAAVQFSHSSYALKFPLLVKAGVHIGKIIDKFQFPEKQEDKLVQQPTGSYNSAVDNAGAK